MEIIPFQDAGWDSIAPHWDAVAGRCANVSVAAMIQTSGAEEAGKHTPLLVVWFAFDRPQAKFTDDSDER